MALVAGCDRFADCSESEMKIDRWEKRKIELNNELINAERKLRRAERDVKKIAAGIDSIMVDAPHFPGAFNCNCDWCTLGKQMDYEVKAERLFWEVYRIKIRIEDTDALIRQERDKVLETPLFSAQTEPVDAAKSHESSESSSTIPNKPNCGHLSDKELEAMID